MTTGIINKEDIEVQSDETIDVKIDDLSELITHLQAITSMIGRILEYAK